MTPHRALLTNFTTILPKPISAANKHLFNAMGQGNLKLEVPNGKSVTNIMLKEVLYTPDIMVTLIAIGHIDQAGYSSTFQGKACTIHDSQGQVISQIPLQNGLYKIERNGKIEDHAFMTNGTNPLTIMDLHHHMGHIAPDTAKRLVIEGLITGVKLNGESKLEPCHAHMPK